jgi:hypothetical protein
MAPMRLGGQYPTSRPADATIGGMALTPLEAILCFFGLAGLVVILVVVLRTGRDKQDDD